MTEVLVDEGLLSSSGLRRALLDTELHRFVPELYVPQTHQSFAGVGYSSANPQANELEAIYSGHPFVLSLSDSGAPRRRLLPTRTAAFMLESLAIEPRMSAIEIGTRTGYEAALMHRLIHGNGAVRANCTSVEDVLVARDTLSRLGLHEIQVTGPGDVIAPPGSIDRVLVTVGCKEADPAWLEMLTVSGFLVMPFWLGGWYPILKIWFEDGRFVGQVIGSAGNSIDPIDGLGAEDLLVPRKTWSADVQEHQLWADIEPNRLMDFWFYLGLASPEAQLIIVTDSSDRITRGLGVDLGGNDWAIITSRTQRLLGTDNSLRMLEEYFGEWRELGSPRKADYHVQLTKDLKDSESQVWQLNRTWYDYIFTLRQDP